MFHDESFGEKKLSLVVVKIFIKKDGVRLRQAVDHSLCPLSVGLFSLMARQFDQSVG